MVISDFVFFFHSVSSNSIGNGVKLILGVIFYITYNKVQKFWEGQKISYFVMMLQSNFKKRWDIFFTFCGLLTISEFYWS